MKTSKDNLIAHLNFTGARLSGESHLIKGLSLEDFIYSFCDISDQLDSREYSAFIAWINEYGKYVNPENMKIHHSRFFKGVCLKLFKTSLNQKWIEISNSISSSGNIEKLSNSIKTINEDEDFLSVNLSAPPSPRDPYKFITKSSDYFKGRVSYTSSTEDILKGKIALEIKKMANYQSVGASELAEKSGVSRTIVSFIFNGKYSKVKLGSMFKVLECLNTLTTSENLLLSKIKNL